VLKKVPFFDIFPVARGKGKRKNVYSAHTREKKLFLVPKGKKKGTSNFQKIPPVSNKRVRVANEKKGGGKKKKGEAIQL